MTIRKCKSCPKNEPSQASRGIQLLLLPLRHIPMLHPSPNFHGWQLWMWTLAAAHSFMVWHWQPPYLVQTQLFVDIQFPVGKQLHKRLGALRRLFCPLRQILQIIFRNYNWAFCVYGWCNVIDVQFCGLCKCLRTCEGIASMAIAVTIWTFQAWKILAALSVWRRGHLLSKPHHLKTEWWPWEPPPTAKFKDEIQGLQ